MPGYDASFLAGMVLPMPKFRTELSAELLNKGEVFHYPNYSVVMNGSPDKRSPVIACLNIDQVQLKSTKRTDRWRIDPRIGVTNQLDNNYYKNNPWDKGHMARRASAAWGSTVRDAQYASDETFYYSNCMLQHQNLNQDEWLGLEDWVYQLDLGRDGKITSMCGPIYADFDRSIRPSGRQIALIPAGFFKVVCFINKQTEKLDARAFIMYQDAKALSDRRGRSRYDNQSYQVTITEIEEKTGLMFEDAIYEANPLYFSDANVKPEENVILFPEEIEVAGPQDLIAAGDKRQTILDDIIDVFVAVAMPDPKGSDAGNEWVSLINLGSEPVDLNGWKLGDNSDRQVVIDSIATDSASLTLRPGDSIVLKGLEPLRLANKGGVIKLFNDKNERIDWVNYTKKMVATDKPVLFLAPRNTLQIQ
ncbi:DNA/RNA non-specific endonuclease [Cyanobium sp. LEGE 06143]|uniref:DNA/RNA non-specific endonuclease n=1 Tax=Cyanobium sp. LEGE 06143 TaxID=945727 RepID=UPI00187F7DDC|nr:DNA/RNA non-specific endonuclease [Cyanobium sp. LEGE 06143]MBE9171702.1 DNA/RNA non-specific endonuclease [Cyanobium sp. LEGE 06143]